MHGPGPTRPVHAPSADRGDPVALGHWEVVEVGSSRSALRLTSRSPFECSCHQYTPRRSRVQRSFETRIGDRVVTLAAPLAECTLAIPMMRRSLTAVLLLLVFVPLLGAKTLPSVARTQILILEGALDAFKLDHGRY